MANVKNMQRTVVSNKSSGRLCPFIKVGVISINRVVEAQRIPDSATIRPVAYRYDDPFLLAARRIR